MIKKSALLFMLAVFVISIAGCETVKGAIQGAKEDRKGAIQVTKKVCKGTVQVAKKGWQSVQEIDDWMRKNLW